jgi:hypothetical protein
MNRLVLLSMALLLTATLSQAAIFSEGFESGMGNWTQRVAGTPSQIAIAGGHNGDYMSSQAAGSSWKADLMRHNLDEAMTNVTVIFWVSWDSSLDYAYNPSGTYIVACAKPNYVEANNDSQGIFARFFNWENPAVSGDGRTNYLGYRTSNSVQAPFTITDIQLVSDTWYEAKFVYDATGVKGYWNGQLMFTDTTQTSVKGLEFGTEWASITAYAGSGGMHTDDISVSAIPEPATLTLIVCSLFLIKQKK